MIQIGDNLPQVTFSLRENDQGSNPTTAELFAGKTVILFAVPGAFTPTCSQAHLPGYVSLADKFQAKGVDSIICLSVNDAFVMQAWGQSQNAEHVTMLADGGAEFTQAIGLGVDSGTFGGIRSRRYAMLVRDGKVVQLQLEQPKEFNVKGAGMAPFL